MNYLLEKEVLFVYDMYGFGGWLYMLGCGKGVFMWVM